MNLVAQLYSVTNDPREYADQRRKINAYCKEHGYEVNVWCKGDNQVKPISEAFDGCIVPNLDCISADPAEIVSVFQRENARGKVIVVADDR